MDDKEADVPFFSIAPVSIGSYNAKERSFSIIFSSSFYVAKKFRLKTIFQVNHKLFLADAVYHSSYSSGIYESTLAPGKLLTFLLKTLLNDHLFKFESILSPVIKTVLLGQTHPSLIWT